MKVMSHFADGLRVFVKDVMHGCFEVVHNGLAVAGLVSALAVCALLLQPQLRHSSEVVLLGWLQERHIVEPTLTGQADAVDRATATNPHDLPKQQAAVAFWLAKKYRVAPEPLGALVAAAYEMGMKVKIDPTLILAIMAIESGFNPFAQSPVGAQGLMQVMTKVHTEKYSSFGGNLAAFDPVTNLRVGVKVLTECIRRAGSIEGGLAQYVGATSDATEGGYTAKVLAEQARLQQVISGAAFVAPNAPVAIPSVAPALEQSLEPSHDSRIAEL